MTFMFKTKEFKQFDKVNVIEDKINIQLDMNWHVIGYQIKLSHYSTSAMSFGDFSQILEEICQDLAGVSNILTIC